MLCSMSHVTGEAVSELMITHYHQTGSHGLHSKVIVELGMRSISVTSMLLRALDMDSIIIASVLGEAGACMQAMFGWVGNHTSGLFADEQEIIADADMSGEKSIEEEYAGQSGTVPSSLVLGMSLYVLL